ncbi:hypothetical protein GCM10022377_21990 [Zhihengliuella alba]|uniref:Uncharacterized protein n=1 Tax=Zhihengliuella alba TaxID=547018 RepID=A0ABP7DPL7_9MICC
MTEPGTPSESAVDDSNGRYAARVLALFAGGALLTWALLAMMWSGTVRLPISGTVAQLAVNLLVAAAVFLTVKSRRDLAGVAVLQLIIAFVISLVEINVGSVFTWYLGAGLMVWALKLRDVLVAVTAAAAFTAVGFVYAFPTLFGLMPTVALVAALVITATAVGRWLLARRTARLG